jgi:hypothetical protein
MGYDIYLHDPVTQEPIQFDAAHQIHGGNMALGGTTEAWLHITYNYTKHFERVLGKGGVRGIYGKTGAETIPSLKQAIVALGDDVSSDYWAATEGNAKKALAGLLAFAQMRPDGVWAGD